MRAFTAVIARDLRLGLRQGGDLVTLVLFFLSVSVVVPFAVGPDTALLSAIAPGIVWVAALLAQLLTHERLFKADYEEGALVGLFHASLSLEAIVFAKLIAHWLLTGLPLIVIAPIGGVMLGLGGERTAGVMIALLAGTPALCGFVAIGAAVTVGLKRGGLVAPVLVLPLCLPVLIFGTGAAGAALEGAQIQALLLLCAISLTVVALSPFAAALALRISGE